MEEMATMMQAIQAVKGMNDILPEDVGYWHWFEDQLKTLACIHGYQEIRPPIVEKTELFVRSIGAVTDIVSKEMYTFDDRDGTSITLRPEGTAGVVRAGIEHGLLYNQSQRLWYLGPIFRHERPQRGRYRQFYQFGLEAIGFAGPEVEAEQIILLARLWKLLGLENHLSLQINSLGSTECRATYRKVLVDYFTKHAQELDADSQTRLHKNPLRILDSKNPDMRKLIDNAPSLIDYLNEGSTQHFARLQTLLKEANVKFVINPRLVRGLDYYSQTVFEWVTESLGAQGTVAAGGRYDNLIAELGGQATQAFGFAMGMERIIEMIKAFAKHVVPVRPLDAYFILVGNMAQQKGLLLANKLRDNIPGFTVQTHLQGGSFKNQFKKADKSGAMIALILGDDEVAANTVTIKYLRQEQPQETIAETDLIQRLKGSYDGNLHD